MKYDASPYQLKGIYVYDAQIELEGANAKLSAGYTENFRCYDSRFIGGKLHLFDNNLSLDCEFENISIYGNFIYNPTKTYRAWRSSYENSTIRIKSSGYDMNSCQLDDSDLLSENITRPCNINTCEFTQNSKIDNNHFASALYVRNSSFIGSSGIIRQTGGSMHLRCNDFKNYHIGLNEVYCNISSSEKAGYNTFDGTGHYIGYDQASVVKLFDGYNTFEASPGQTQIDLAGQFQQNVTIDARNNYWKKGNSYGLVGYHDEGPVSNRFGFSAGPGQTYTTQATDIEDNQGLEGCGIYDGGDRTLRKNAISDNGSGNGNQKSSEDLIEFPIISSNYFDGIPLDSAVIMSIDLMELNDSLGNDLEALNRFHDIYNWSDTTEIELDEFEWVFDIVFQNMKSTLENLFNADIISPEDNESSFTSEVQKYVDVLMMRTSVDVDEENYIQQFYLEIDKAQLFDLVNKKEMAWYLLNNLDNCPVDSIEQGYLNNLIYSLDAQIITIQSGLNAFLSDSLVVEIDTSQFVIPEPLITDDYYFGAYIFDPNTVTFTNCGNVTWRANIQESDLHFKLYPNPAADRVNVIYLSDAKLEYDLTIQILDITGKVVSENRINADNPNRVIELTGLASGQYLYKISSEDLTVQMGSLIKQ